MKNPYKLVLVHEKFISYGGAELVFEELVQTFATKEKLLTYTLYFDEKFKFNTYKNTLEKLEIKEILKSPIPRFIVRKAYTVKNSFIRGIFQLIMLPLMPIWFASVKFPRDTKVVLVDSLGFETCVLPPPGAVMIAYVHTPLRVIWNLTSTFFATKNKLKQFIRGVLNKFYFAPLRKINKRAFRRIHVIIANSKEVAGRISRFMGRKAKVVNPPVDVNAIAKYTSMPKKDFYVFINRLEPYKLVLETIRYFPTDKKLIIMGKGSLLEAARRLVQKLNKNIEVLGFVSDEKKFRMLAQAKALIYPNLEDFGIGMVEALAVGTYVIGNKRGGAAEIVEHKKTGFLIESISDLDKAINWVEEQFIALDKEKIRQKLTKAASKFDKTNFRAKIKQIVDNAVKKVENLGREN